MSDSDGPAASPYDRAPWPFCVLRGPEHRIAFANPACRQWLGGQWNSGAPLSQAAPQLPPLVLELVDQVFTTGLAGEVEAVAQERGLVDWACEPERGGDGVVEGVYLTAFDRRIHDLEDPRATLVAESIPQLVWVVTPKGAPQFVNRQWVEYTGTGREDIHQAGWTSVLHPNDLEAVEKAWRRSVKEETPFQLEARIRRAVDGAFRWHLCRAEPVRDRAGRVVQWFGTCTDIHDQKSAADAMRFLAEAGAALSASLDIQETLHTVARLAIPRLADWCAVHVVDENSVPSDLAVAHVEAGKEQWVRTLSEGSTSSSGDWHGVDRVIRTGRPELHPYVSEEMLARSAQDEDHLRLLRRVGVSSAMIVPLIARGRTLGAIIFVSGQSGHRYGASNLAIAQELAGRVAYAIDNARLYREAREAIRVRDDFLSVASHELKTPLTPLTLQVQSMRRRRLDQSSPPLSPERTAAKMASIERQVGRLEQLVNGLLDISRLRDRQMVLDCEEIDLRQLVEEVADRFGDDLARHGGSVEVMIEPGLVGCWDRMRMEQLLSHLLHNAIKFGEGRSVEISARAMDEKIELRVSDHGIGIGEEDQARIFERFERAVGTRHYGGFGLGLWMVKQIVGALGGGVRVESARGEGATFVVELPREGLSGETHDRALTTH